MIILQKSINDYLKTINYQCTLCDMIIPYKLKNEHINKHHINNLNGDKKNIIFKTVCPFCSAKPKKFSRHMRSDHLMELDILANGIFDNDKTKSKRNFIRSEKNIIKEHNIFEENLDVECRLCGKILKKRALINHFKSEHKIDIKVLSSRNHYMIICPLCRIRPNTKLSDHLRKYHPDKLNWWAKGLYDTNKTKSIRKSIKKKPYVNIVQGGSPGSGKKK